MIKILGKDLKIEGFIISESLKGYELRFETLEDLRNYFKKNGSERK